MDLEQRLAARYAAREQPAVAHTKMTTGRWLYVMLALVVSAFVFDGTGKIVACAVIVAGVLTNLAIERWAHPGNGD